jgi:hypothetical protein
MYVPNEFLPHYFYFKVLSHNSNDINCVVKTWNHRSLIRESSAGQAHTPRNRNQGGLPLPLIAVRSFLFIDIARNAGAGFHWTE